MFEILRGSIRHLAVGCVTNLIQMLFMTHCRSIMLTDYDRCMASEASEADGDSIHCHANPTLGSRSLPMYWLHSLDRFYSRSS